MSDPVIQTHELTKHFKHPVFIWQIRARALTGLNLVVERGEIFGLLGPNGSGKSTTIKLLLGMLWPTAGEISVFGRRPHDVYVKQRLSYLPEETHLYRFLTAEETLDFYGSLFHLPRRERRRRVEQLLDLTGLRHARSRPLGEFSKGMQRRVGLAQALLNDPELVILDEPTSGLDPLGIREVKNIILELKAKKKTVLLSSHLLDDVEDVCDRVAILYGGKVRAAGTVADLLRDQKQTTITGELSSDLIAKISELIKEHAAVAEIAPAKQRLETLFMQIVRDAEKLQVDTSGARNQQSALDFLTSASAAIRDQLASTSPIVISSQTPEKVVALNDEKIDKSAAEKIAKFTSPVESETALENLLAPSSAKSHNQHNQKEEKSKKNQAKQNEDKRQSPPIKAAPAPQEIHYEVNNDLLAKLTRHDEKPTAENKSGDKK